MEVCQSNLGEKLGHLERAAAQTLEHKKWVCKIAQFVVQALFVCHDNGGFLISALKLLGLFRRFFKALIMGP
jgi:hypothetical protein